MNRQEFIDKLFARAREAGIAECEAYFAGSDELSVDVLNGEIKEYTASSASGMCFRGIYADKMGYASTEIMDEEAIEMLVEGVKQNASLLETEDRETIFAGSEKYAEIAAYDEEVVLVPASKLIQMALDIEKKAKARDARVVRMEGASAMKNQVEKRIVNSLGLDVSFKSAVMGAVSVPIVSENGQVNFAFDMKFGFHKDEIDVDQIVNGSVEKALAGLGASSIPSGNYHTVLRNDAARGVLSTFAGVFSAENARKGRSLLKGREGEQIASEAVTIVDDPLRAGGFASVPFDAEGVATFTKKIVDAGRLTTLLHNRTTAQAMGAQTTGNASKQGYGGPVRVAPTNFFIEPSDKSLEELIREVGNGLLITNLMGMHSGANPISGDFSLGAKGFLIENGQITRPVEQITVASNFFELLKNVRAAASDLEFGMGGSTSIGSPSLDVGMMSVAGK